MDDVFSGARGVELADHASARIGGDQPATLVLPVPADRAWRVSVDGTPLERTTVFGWAQGFKLPGGVSGELDVQRGGQRQRMVFLLIEGLLVLVSVATMARPTRVAPPVAPVVLDDTTTTDLRLATLARGGAR